MEWRPIDGFPEYLVSDAGLIMCNRVPLDGRKSHRLGHVTEGATAHRGYRAIVLLKPGLRKIYRRLVHRLVASAFIPNPLQLSDVAHKDGNTSNNGVSNLRWSTHRDNQMDMRAHGTMQDGEKCCTAKVTNEQAREIHRRAQKRGAGVRLAKEFGLSRAQISRIKNGDRWLG